MWQMVFYSRVPMLGSCCARMSDGGVGCYDGPTADPDSTGTVTILCVLVGMVCVEMVGTKYVVRGVFVGIN